MVPVLPLASAALVMLWAAVVKNRSRRLGHIRCGSLARIAGRSWSASAWVNEVTSPGATFAVQQG